MQCGKLKTYMETGRVVFLPVRSIRPNPAQPRKVFEQTGLQELAASILQHGILQPLSVRRVGTSYELIAGERRLRAAKIAGLEEVPCLLMSMDEGQSGIAALVENLQRRDLDFIEEAEGLSRLMQLGGSPRSRPPCGWERVSPPWPISSVFCVTVPPCWRPCGLPVSRNVTPVRF